VQMSAIVERGVTLKTLVSVAQGASESTASPPTLSAVILRCIAPSDAATTLRVSGLRSQSATACQLVGAVWVR